MEDMTRSKMVDTLNTAVAICDLAKQERAAAGFATIDRAKNELVRALVARRAAWEALEAYDKA